jgi:molybdopterin molybdotransferase
MKEQRYPTRQWVMEELFRQWNVEWGTEEVPIGEAAGRVLARDQYSRCSIPFERASGMDGIGVRSADFADGIPDVSGWQPGRDYVRADTGDDFEDRYDAVIRIENVVLDEEGRLCGIRPGVTVQPGMGIRPRGSMLKEGDCLARAGRVLRPVELAALAMGNVLTVPVYRKPRVAFIPTGSELIPVGTALTRGKNYDSNSVLAEHLLREMGAEPILFPIIKDVKEEIESVLDRAIEQADIILINGGSSKGSEDYNARILEARGTVVCHGVAAAPGKPLCAAVLDNKPVVNIPGPSAAVFYEMDWCVRGLVNRLLHIPMPKRPCVTCTLTEAIQAPADMEILCKMNIHKSAGGYEGAQVSFRGGTVAETLCSDAMYVTKLGLSGHEAGEKIEVELLEGEEFLEPFPYN